MIVVTGATGHTGSVVAEKLLEAGEKVRVVGRSAEKLQRFVAKGAEAFVGDVMDAAAMSIAFTAADAVYAMIPPSMSEKDFYAYQARVTESLAVAIERAGVKHVVALSSIGADKAEKCGPVTGLHRFEQRLNKTGVNILHLRPGYFMENLLQFIGLIKAMGMMAGTLRGDLPIEMIATRDIGAVAAEALAKRDFTGQQARELLGAREVTMSEAAVTIGRAIGKSLSYSKMPEMVVKPAMIRMGMSDDVARLLLEMMEAMNSGWMAPQEPRSPANTTPTTIEAWVEEIFLPAYRA